MDRFVSCLVLGGVKYILENSSVPDSCIFHAQVVSQSMVDLPMITIEQRPPQLTITHEAKLDRPKVNREVKSDHAHKGRKFVKFNGPKKSRTLSRSLKAVEHETMSEEMQTLCLLYIDHVHKDMHKTAHASAMEFAEASGAHVTHSGFYTMIAYVVYHHKTIDVTDTYPMKYVEGKSG